MFLALKQSGNTDLITSNDISEVYGISRNHLSKIIHQLSKLGYIESFKGASGGIRLIEKPKNINLGKLIREMENDFHIVECFNKDAKTACRISPSCKLKSIINESLNQFLNNLSRYSLADIIENRIELLNDL